MESNYKLAELTVEKQKKLYKDYGYNFKVTRLANWNYKHTTFLEKEANKVSGPKIYFEQGSFIKVDFGINIGREFSGPHFAIVLDKHDNINKDTITVVPLSSQHNKKYITVNKVMFEEATASLTQKIDMLEKRVRELKEKNKKTRLLSEEINENKYLRNPEKATQELIQIFKDEVEDKEISIRNIRDYLTFKDYIVTRKLKESEKEISECETDSNELITCKNHYDHYSKNSFAVISGVTTISKSRIYPPINKNDPIGRIKVSKEEINRIKSAFLKSYIWFNVLFGL